MPRSRRETLDDPAGPAYDVRIATGAERRATEGTSMLVRWFGMGLGLAALLVAGVARGEDTAEGDLKRLEGTWTVPSNGGGDVAYTFKGKTLKVEAPTRSYQMTVTLDARARPDKTIDFKIDEGPEDAKGKTSRG